MICATASNSEQAHFLLSRSRLPALPIRAIETALQWVRKRRSRAGPSNVRHPAARGTGFAVAHFSSAGLAAVADGRCSEAAVLPLNTRLQVAVTVADGGCARLLGVAWTKRRP